MHSILTGPTSARLDSEANIIRKELTQNVKEEDWRFKAVNLINQVLEILGIKKEKHIRESLINWYSSFVELRNKTRGHGATPHSKIDKCCVKLFNSLSLMIDNLSILKLTWVYLRRNLSQKYRVSYFNKNMYNYDFLKNSKEYDYKDGVHIKFTEDRFCALIHTDPDLCDFYFANGRFKEQHYEALSYISGETIELESKNYLTPVENLPKSITEGKGSLYEVGNVLTNIPELDFEYIHRKKLESTLKKEIINNEIHLIVTLDGRGGVGKTSTAIQVIRELVKAEDCPYLIVIWFSSRDIDLFPDGAKIVEPSAISIKEFSKQYFKLVENLLYKEEDKKLSHNEFFASQLRLCLKNTFGGKERKLRG